MSEQELRDAMIALARRYAFEEGHSLQDERLALQLFDETARLRLHDLDEPGVADLNLTPRTILSYAAILHDIGYVAGYEQHHKTAFRLIMAEPIPGVSLREKALVAHVARYHRGGVPDLAKHQAYAALSADDQRLTAQLAAILRFADGLDRTHTDAVRELQCALDGNRFLVTLLPGVDDEAERWAGQKKARWFEGVYGVQVVLAGSETPGTPSTENEEQDPAD